MPRVRRTNEGGLRFHCPGCDESHIVNVSGGHPGWVFNDDVERSVLTPSVLVRTGHYCNNPPVPGNCGCDWNERHPDEEPWDWPCSVCHSFVGCNGALPGQIKFLDDCTHALKGQTVDLPEMPDATG